MLTPSPVALSRAAGALTGRTAPGVRRARGGAWLSQFWIRPLDGVQAQLVVGTEGASFPFWSPDNRFVGFFAGGKLKKVDPSGGAPEVLCNAAGGRRRHVESRGHDRVQRLARTARCSRIAAAGRRRVGPQRRSIAEQGVTARITGRSFCPTAGTISSTSEVQSPNIKVSTWRRWTLLKRRASSSAWVLDISSGYLLFVRDGMLFAQTFDDRALPHARAKPCASPITSATLVRRWAMRAVSVSPAGVLAYGPNVALTTTLQWRDRDGATRGSSIAPSQYRSPRLVAGSAARRGHQVGARQQSVRHLGARTGSRQPVARDVRPDERLVSCVVGRRRSDLLLGRAARALRQSFKKLVSEPDQFSRVVETARAPPRISATTSSDGRFLIYAESSPRAYDLGVVPLSGAAKPGPFLASPFNEVQSRFAPNSRWIGMRLG